jgi:hypothetical protein
MIPVFSEISVLTFPPANDNTTMTRNNGNSDLERHVNCDTVSIDETCNHLFDSIEGALGIPFLLNFGTEVGPDGARQQSVVNFFDTTEDEDTEPLPLYVEPPSYSVAIGEQQEEQGHQEHGEQLVPVAPTLSPLVAFGRFSWADMLNQAAQIPLCGLDLPVFNAQDALPAMWQNADHGGCIITGGGAMFHQQQSLGANQLTSGAYHQPESGGVFDAQGDNFLGLAF